VEPGAGDRAERAGRFLEGTVERARYIMVLPVVLLLLASLGAFVYGVALFIDSARRIVDHPFPIGKNVGLFVVLIDIFLVGATLLIAALGFYELFVARDVPRQNHTLLPGWLVMRDLNDLKVRVVSMLVLVSAVSFVDVVVDFQGGRDVLYLGSGVALIIVALTVFIRFGARDRS
jgi:uncharacterized membrane protein YqhA